MDIFLFPKFNHRLKTLKIDTELNRVEPAWAAESPVIPSVPLQLEWLDSDETGTGEMT